MSDEGSQDKQLPASQRKLDKARKDGQVVRSKDLGHFLVMLAANGSLDISAAFPVILGANLGTTSTALISSLGTKRNGKRAALLHFLFNFKIFFFSCSILSFAVFFNDQKNFSFFGKTKKAI